MARISLSQQCNTGHRLSIKNDAKIDLVIQTFHNRPINRTTVHNPKFGISFFFARFPERLLFLSFPLPTRSAIFVGSKRIQTYRNVQLSIPSCRLLFFLPVHKIIIFIVHIFPLLFSSNISRLPIIILFSFHLPIRPRHRHNK